MQLKTNTAVTGATFDIDGDQQLVDLRTDDRRHGEQPLSFAAAIVDRYTEWADWTGWADEQADRRPRQGTGTDSAENSLHVFAKVRVAGSNPVVRSKKSCSTCLYERQVRGVLPTCPRNCQGARLVR